MSRRLLRLDGDAVARLPEHCRGCLFWELGGACPAGSSQDPAGRDADETRKQAWAAAVAQSGSSPGRVVEVDGEVVAHAVFAPAEAFAPRPAPAPRPDDDSLLLASAWVQPQWRGLGLGRALLHATLREAHRQERRVVAAYGDRRWLERRCVLPATWLLHEGFEVRREHPRMPLFAIDVRRTARWAETLEHAVEEVLGRLPRRARTPAPVPAPAAHAAAEER